MLSGMLQPQLGTLAKSWIVTAFPLSAWIRSWGVSRTRHVRSDIIADDLLGPLENLNQMDFSSIGQKIGGFLHVGINSFKDGTFSDFIGLSIEAGFEQGMSAARKLWNGLFQSDGDLWKSAVNGVLTLGTKIDEMLLSAFQNPLNSQHGSYLRHDSGSQATLI